MCRFLHLVITKENQIAEIYHFPILMARRLKPSCPMTSSVRHFWHFLASSYILRKLVLPLSEVIGSLTLHPWWKDIVNFLPSLLACQLDLSLSSYIVENSWGQLSYHIQKILPSSWGPFCIQKKKKLNFYSRDSKHNIKICRKIVKLLLLWSTSHMGTHFRTKKRYNLHT